MSGLKLIHVCKGGLCSQLDCILPSKTELPEPNWKKCKLLGGKTNTKFDIENQKAKTWKPSNLQIPIFKSKRIGTAPKSWVFHIYVEPVLPYNAEVWALTPTLEDKIDAFYHRLQRLVLNIHYPKINKAEKFYAITKTFLFSSNIKRRRLNSFELVLRLHPDSSVQIGLREPIKPQKRPLWHQPLTWIRNYIS